MHPSVVNFAFNAALTAVATAIQYNETLSCNKPCTQKKQLENVD